MRGRLRGWRVEAGRRDGGRMMRRMGGERMRREGRVQGEGEGAEKENGRVERGGVLLRDGGCWEGRRG